MAVKIKMENEPMENKAFISIKAIFDGITTENRVLLKSALDRVMASQIEDDLMAMPAKYRDLYCKRSEWQKPLMVHLYRLLLSEMNEADYLRHRPLQNYGVTFAEYSQLTEATIRALNDAHPLHVRACWKTIVGLL